MAGLIFLLVQNNPAPPVGDYMLRTYTVKELIEALDLFDKNQFVKVYVTDAGSLQVLTALIDITKENDPTLDTYPESIVRLKVQIP